MDHLPPDTLAALTAALATLDGPDAARARRALGDGTYGLCATCGELLAADALRARPTLATCPDCAEARRQERAGQRFGVCGVKPR